MNVDRVTSESLVSKPGVMEGQSRQDLLLRIYEKTKTIAVVGASSDERKAAHIIPSYLQSQGYQIIPVNPWGGEILGEHVYPSLKEIDALVDVVDVFRPPVEAETIAREAVAVGADVLWYHRSHQTRCRCGAYCGRWALHECNARRTGARTGTT